MAEKEYIEREAMIQRLKNTPLFSNFNTGGIFLRDGVIDLVEKQPAADVVEVRHGKRKFAGYSLKGEKVYCCSECDFAVANIEDVAMKFCPGCGAKMDGERKE